jgi:hypothetical protein
LVAPPGRSLDGHGQTVSDPFATVFVVLPYLTSGGELDPGVYLATWLSGRLRTILKLAATGGRLRRVFVWGSFVTAKPAPRDLDILLIMNDDFEVDQMSAPAKAIFDCTRAKLLFESDIFWARASIGQEALDLWLQTYQTSRSFRKRGIVELELP